MQMTLLGSTGACLINQSEHLGILGAAVSQVNAPLVGQQTASKI